MCTVEHLGLYEKVLKQSVYTVVIGLKLIHYFCNDYNMKLMILNDVIDYIMNNTSNKSINKNRRSWINYYLWHKLKRNDDRWNELQKIIESNVNFIALDLEVKGIKVVKDKMFSIIS